jgi:hypothetical protein
MHARAEIDGGARNQQFLPNVWTWSLRLELPFKQCLREANEVTHYLAWFCFHDDSSYN